MAATLDNPELPVKYRDTPISSVYGTTINIDFSADLTLDHESEVPLLTLLGKLKTAKTATHQFKFAVGRFAPRTSTTTAEVAATAVGTSATVPVADGTVFNVSDVVEVPDVNDDATHTSQLLITGITTNDLTCRPYKPATYGVSAIASGATVRKIFSAMIEGSSGRWSHQTVPTVYDQYIQIFEDYFDVTNVQAENRQYTQPERARLREEARKKHALDQEYALYLAKKVQDTSTTGKPRYQMDGLDAQTISWVLTYGDNLLETNLFDFIRKVHNPAYTGGNKRLVVSSLELISRVNKLITERMRATPRDTTWGPGVTDIQFGDKVWSFVEAPALSAARTGYGYVVHPMFLRKRVFMPTTYRMNVQNPIDNFFKDGFITAMALEQRLEEVAGKIKP